MGSNPTPTAPTIFYGFDKLTIYNIYPEVIEGSEVTRLRGRSYDGPLRLSSSEASEAKARLVADEQRPACLDNELKK